MKMSRLVGNEVCDGSFATLAGASSQPRIFPPLTAKKFVTGVARLPMTTSKSSRVRPSTILPLRSTTVASISRTCTSTRSRTCAKSGAAVRKRTAAAVARMRTRLAHFLFAGDVLAANFHNCRKCAAEHVVPRADAAPLMRNRFDVRERLGHRLCPAQVRQARDDFAVADEERAVA